MTICKEHQEDMIRISSEYKLFCGVCGEVVEDYVICRTDKYRNV